MSEVGNRRKGVTTSYYMELFGIINVMANKKRKTREQKEKAAQRRAAQKPSSSSSPANTAAPTKSTAQPSKKPAEKTEHKNEKDERHKERMRTMRISVQVFGGLVAVQLLLWGLDYAGVISLDVL